ncbi:MAG: low molecular weight protein-tyrosine-phosphatase [Gammaproteobacteria bacterium]
MRTKEQKQSVLFVCMGNICRSPTAEGVFRSLVERAGLADKLVIDSAGTHDYHVGHPPDARAVLAANARGIDLSALRARQVTSDDLLRFDYVLAMDNDNLSHLKELSASTASESTAQITLLLDFLPGVKGRSVPDPYFGGENGFTLVLDQVEEACQHLLAAICRDKQA